MTTTFIKVSGHPDCRVVQIRSDWWVLQHFRDGEWHYIGRFIDVEPSQETLAEAAWIHKLECLGPIAFETSV